LKRILILCFSIFTATLCAQKKDPDFIKTDGEISINYYPEINLDIEKNIDLKKYEKDYIKSAEDPNKEILINFLNEKKHLNSYDKYSIEVLKAMLYLEIKDFNQATTSIEKAINFAPNDSLKSDFYFILSIVKNNQQNQIEAVKYAIKSFELDQLNYKKAFIIGNLYLGLKDDENAILYYIKGLYVKPKYNNFRNKIGFMYQKLEKYDLAIEEFNKVIAIEQDAAFAYNNRAYCYLKLNKTDKAIIDVNKSIALNDKNSYAYRNRALIYLSIKKNDLACSDFNKAIELGFVLDYGSSILMEKALNCD
jgi:tetratricopeptide (TPR) repeat protein